MSDRLSEIFADIGISYGIVLMEWNHDSDHVHVLFRTQPSTLISKFMKAYKSAGSRLRKKGISADSAEVVEGILLVKVILPCKRGRSAA